MISRDIDDQLPLISVTIPTRNEERTLPHTLESVFNQNGVEYEVIVIDSNSTDRTRAIAEDKGAKVIDYEGKLLGARFIGVREARGDYVLLLDADQILKRDSLRRALEMIGRLDMLVFEEDSFEPRTYVQRALAREREMEHKKENRLDPIRGALLPRFFKKGIIAEAFENIPKELLPVIVAHDHALIHWEARKISSKVGILPDAISHIEPDTVRELILHNYRFGRSTRSLARTGFYKDIFAKKTFRSGNLRGAMKAESIFVPMIRSLSYTMGYMLG